MCKWHWLVPHGTNVWINIRKQCVLSLHCTAIMVLLLEYIVPIFSHGTNIGPIRISGREYNASVSHASVPGKILLQNRMIICGFCARGGIQSTACMRGGKLLTSALQFYVSSNNPPLPSPMRECEGRWMGVTDQERAANLPFILWPGCSTIVALGQRGVPLIEGLLG